MKNLTVTVASLTMLCFASASEAAPIYWELYAGSTLGGQSLNYGPATSNAPNLVSMDSGLSGGAGIYWDVSGFDIGLDFMMTDQDYSTWGPGSNLSTTSLMVNGRYHVGLGSGITGYIGAGLGAINVAYDDPAAFLDGSDMIAGWQAEAGIKYNFGPTTTFMGLKYQQGFDQAYIQSEYVEYNSLTAIAGIRIPW